MPSDPSSAASASSRGSGSGVMADVGGRDSETGRIEIARQVSVDPSDSSGAREATTGDGGAAHGGRGGDTPGQSRSADEHPSPVGARMGHRPLRWSTNSSALSSSPAPRAGSAEQVDEEDDAQTEDADADADASADVGEDGDGEDAVSDAEG